MIRSHYIQHERLTIDNRDHATHTETQQDEITALRNARRTAQERIAALTLRIDTLESDNAVLSLQNAELAELVKVRDEQIASFNDLDHGIAGSAVPPINP